MPGITLTDLSRPAGGHGDQRPARGVFGQRQAAARTMAPPPPRSVDYDVPDLRRRIGNRAAPKRLPLAISGAVIVALSAMLWLDTFEIATMLARALARMF
jgi:hypothetical protein